MSKPDTVPETAPVDETMEETADANDASADDESDEIMEKPKGESPGPADELIKPIEPKPKRVPFERREEVYLRKRKDQREKKMAWLERKRKRKERKSANQLKIQLKTLNFRTPFRDIKKYIRRERQLWYAARRMRITKKVKHWRYAIPKDTPELLIVVRIKIDRYVAVEFKEIMRKMGLNIMHQAVIVRKTEELCDNLIRLGPFTTYGCPSAEAVRDLLHRRGTHVTYEDGKKKKIPLTDNRMIEDALGEYDIICVDDLVEEIMTLGPAFDKCLKFLGPFRVTPAKDKRWNYNKQFSQGGDWGYRKGNKIMELFI